MNYVVKRHPKADVATLAVICTMKKIVQTLIIICFFSSCKEEEITKSPVSESEFFISAVDISSYPEIALANPNFYDLAASPKDFLLILKENGINTIRLRVWVHPKNVHSGFNEVKAFAQSLKSKGFNIWLTVHYSDTWADPANQQTPALWNGLDFKALKDSVYAYTKNIVMQIKPDYIQIGNEINAGLLHPYGNINTNYANFLDLIQTGVLAVRQHSSDCKIILHFAGLQHSDWFFDQVKTIDYDIMGLSYYPIWHGKSFLDLKSKMQELSAAHQKKIVIAETAYPFTLGWNDWTNNIVGQNDQLILPEYPATHEGQRNFVSQVKRVVKETPNGIGFCYWGAELIAWNGSQATNGSTWENQALFDFNNQALPVLNVFKE